MKKNIQKSISDSTGIHPSTLSNIMRGARRPSWKKAKILAEVTGTDPVLWLEGTPEQIRQAVSCDGAIA